MSSFKRSDVKVFSKFKKQSEEHKFWRKFRVSVLLKEFGAVDYIHFSPVEPYYFAVTSSARVQIYDPVTKLSYKNLNKFKEAAFGGSFRPDGKLLCAGSEDSVIRLFDVSNRNLLRKFKGHNAAVHRTFFTSDNSYIASFSDDKSVKIWDIVTEKPLCQYQEHIDYIRAGCVSPTDPNVILSAGYDKIIKMYDIRSKSVICSLDHEAPVESVLFLPSGSIFISAGGKEVRIWDAFSRNLLARCTRYHKTVTTMCCSLNGKRLLTGSLDQRIKIIDLVSYKVVHTINYNSSILSVAINKDNNILTTGTVNGIVNVQTKTESSVPKNNKIDYKYFGDTTTKIDSVVDKNVVPAKKHKLAKFEKALRKFQYSKALDCVMVETVSFRIPAVAVTLLDELIRRKGLEHAVSNKNSKQLALLLRFIIRYIHVEQFTKVLIKVCDIIIDVYYDSIDSYSSEVQKLFETLRDSVKDEIESTKDLLKLQGALEMIFTAACSNNNSTIINQNTIINKEKE